jgi:hypothetical protein
MKKVVPDNCPSANEGSDVDESGTMIQHGTLLPNVDSIPEIGSKLGTFVINEVTAEKEECLYINLPSTKYRPAGSCVKKPTAGSVIEPRKEQQQLPVVHEEEIYANCMPQILEIGNDQTAEHPATFKLSIAEEDFEALKHLSVEELSSRMGNLDQEMELGIDYLQMKYHVKRQPILDAINKMRKTQQNF